MNPYHITLSALAILAGCVAIVSLCMFAARDLKKPVRPGARGKLWLTAGERLRAGDRWVGADKPLGRFHEMAGMGVPGGWEVL